MRVYRPINEPDETELVVASDINKNVPNKGKNECTIRTAQFRSQNSLKESLSATVNLTEYIESCPCTQGAFWERYSVRMKNARRILAAVVQR